MPLIFILTYVSASVRHNRLLKKVTRAEVEMVVKLWLRCAIDRSGGRAARQQKCGRPSSRIRSNTADDYYDDDSDVEC